MKYCIILSLLITVIVYSQKDNFQNAELQCQEKKYLEAVKSYQAAIKQSANYEPAWLGLQNAYIRSGELESARELNNIDLSDRLQWGQIRVFFYLNQFDTIPQLIFELTRKYLKSEYINDALDLGIIIAETKNDTMNLQKYAQALYNYEITDYENGIKIIKDLIVKSDIIAQYSYLLLSKFYSGKNEFNQAIGTLNEFSVKFQKSRLYPKARYELGIIYLESIKDTIMAKDVLEDLISDFPESPESYFARSRLSLIGPEIKSK